MRNRTFTKLAVIGVASAMLVPAGASAQPMDGQAIAAGGGPGVTAQSLRASEGRDGQGSIAQDFRAPDQAYGGLHRSPSKGGGVTAEDYSALNQAPTGLQAAPQDLRAPDQVTPTTPDKPVLNAAPHWPAHPQTLQPRSDATSSSKSDDGTIDTPWLIGLGGLAVVSLAGLGLVYRIRVRNARQHAAA
jgi:hypothetical protein